METAALILERQLSYFQHPEQATDQKAAPMPETEADRPTYQAQSFPTPTANRRDGLQSHGINVVSGQLNPMWVEWLMAWPSGWTDLKPLGTAKFQEWSRSHGNYLRHDES